MHSLVPQLTECNSSSLTHPVAPTQVESVQVRLSDVRHWQRSCTLTMTHAASASSGVQMPALSSRPRLNVVPKRAVRCLAAKQPHRLDDVLRAFGVASFTFAVRYLRYLSLGLPTYVVRPGWSRIARHNGDIIHSWLIDRSPSCPLADAMATRARCCLPGCGGATPCIACRVVDGTKLAILHPHGKVPFICW